MHFKPLITIATLVVSFGVSTVAANAQKMYWTEDEKIRRANLDGSNVEDLVTTVLFHPDYIDLNTSTGKMYWAEQMSEPIGQIRRANLDGSNIETVVPNLYRIGGIAVDPVGGKIYWTTSFDKYHRIQRSDLDGSNVEDLVSEVWDPMGIALDLTAGKMYWVGDEGVQRANMDGSNIEDLVSTGSFYLAGIALDPSGGKVYWTDFGADKVQRANLDGSNVEDLITTGLDNPSGLALDLMRGKMYWTEPPAGTIRRADLDGSNIEQVMAGLPGPFGIAIDPGPPIPTLSEWGIVAMGSLLVIAGILFINHRSGTVTRRGNDVRPERRMLYG